MSGLARLSRRQVLGLIASLLGGTALAAEKPKGSGDNGIGGTGYKPPADNGIGGTGFIGTIRKFGSVWVNGERIAYPSDVSIRIDGETAQPPDMRIGEIARLIAHRGDQGWTTDGIVIVSEVVGPIARIDGKRLVVLGQTVTVQNAKMARGLKVGDRVAVSGLRRPDQTIVASRIAKRAAGPDQITGVLTEANGDFRIGDMSLSGVGRGVVGERIVARGALTNGQFAAREVKLDSVASIGAVESVSVETWVENRDGAVETAGGLRVEDGAAAFEAGSQHVVINGVLGQNGALIANTVAFPNRAGGFAPPRGGSGGSGGGFGPGGGSGGPGGGFGPGGGANGPGGFGPGRGGSGTPGGPTPQGGFGTPSGTRPSGGLPSFEPGGGFGGFGPPGGMGRFGGPGGGPPR